METDHVTLIGEPFQFEVKAGDRSYNQAHYEALGVCVGNYIEELLVTKYHLKPQPVPIEGSDGHEDIPRSHIYISEHALTTHDTLLVLIQGSGVVRPGQWSRSVIINENLEVKISSLMAILFNSKSDSFRLSKYLSWDLCFRTLNVLKTTNGKS
jgi:hypothetical protein